MSDAMPPPHARHRRLTRSRDYDAPGQSASIILNLLHFGITVKSILVIVIFSIIVLDNTTLELLCAVQ